MKKHNRLLGSPKNNTSLTILNKRGITLVLILLILTSLIILAIPFTSSMLFKEKSSKDVLQTTQSRFSAIGAHNSAINLLLRTHNFYELNPDSSAPFNTPDYDTSNEFETNLYQFSQIPSNPKGIIWSALVEDEQGKINLTTAPNQVVNQLKTLLKPGDDPQHFVTKYSYRSTAWSAAQNLAGYQHYRTADGKDFDCIIVDNNISYIPNPVDGRVRLQQGNEEFNAYGNGAAWEGEIVIGPEVRWRNMGTRYNIRLDRVVPGNFLNETTTIEIEQPHPVNINTASKEVLTALIAGLGYYRINPPADRTISVDDAKALAEEIKSRTFTKQIELEEFISNTNKISIEQKGYLLTNIFYPRYDSLVYRGTLPFCFRSFDIYTINSTGIINRTSGSQAGQTTLNEIVDIAPVGQVITWSIESQYDFDYQFYTLLGNPLKMVTYPELTNSGSRFYLTPSARNPSYLRTANSGYLKLRAAEDTRNRGIKLLNSFSDTYDEGMSPPLDYNRDSIFEFYGISDTGRYGIHAGGLEFWIKFNDQIPAGKVYFFDIKQADYENRLALWHENNELVLSVCDATVDRKASQIRAPSVNLEANVWYHIGAYWKEPKYAQLSLFLDGRPVGSFGHYNDSDQKILAELSADIPDEAGMVSATQMTISVNSTAGFPPSGAIEIGEEIIAYISTTPNTFVVPTTWFGLPPSLFPQQGRGIGLSQIVAHPSGAKVTIHGYSTAFVPTIRIAGYPDITFANLPKCNGRLTDAFPDPLNSFVALATVISPSDTDISVASNINSWPPRGYICIENEVVYYVSHTNFAFSNCIRGALGTTASSHGVFIPPNTVLTEDAFLYSLQVDDYTNYPSPVLIQIDDEWIGPVQKSQQDGFYFFTGIVNGGIPLQIRRGWVYAPVTHSAGASIIPVLAAALSGTARNDVITIIETDQTTNPKEEYVIRNALVITETNVNLFAFTENLRTRSYNIDSITRLVKFPSDELPSYLPTTLTIGSNLDATIDEIKFMSSEKGYYVTEEILQSSDTGKTSVQFNGATLNTCGIVKVGDEYIGYATKSGANLTNCKRGYLKSPVLTHDKKQRAINLSSFFPVSALTVNISEDNPTITVTDGTSTGFSTNGGYLLIGNDLDTAEVVGYCNITDSSFVMPAHSNGIFRGMFGTTKQAHNVNTLCYGIPFRYWDLQKEDAFDNQMAYFQSAHYARGATWKKISWNETHIPPNDNLVRLRVLVRFNNQPAWNTPPTNQKDGIFVFTNPNGANNLNVKADQIEVMVFSQYLPGAFSPSSNSNAWKRSPRLENIYVEYEKPIVTISHQER